MADTDPVMKCHTCDVADEFDEEAQAAFDVVADFVKARTGFHAENGKLPSGLGEAIVGGLMQGLVASAWSMAGERNQGKVQDYLVELMALAIEDEKAALPTRGMMQ